MAMLVGSSEHNIDENGRIVIPSKFREIIGPEIYLSFSKKLDAIEGFLEERFNELAAAYDELTTEEDILATEEFFAGVHTVNIDKQGRMTVPAELREKCGFKDKIKIIGMRNRIIIRNAENEAPKATEEKINQLRQKMEEEIREGRKAKNT